MSTLCEFIFCHSRICWSSLQKLLLINSERLTINRLASPATLRLQITHNATLTTLRLVLSIQNKEYVVMKAPLSDSLVPHACFVIFGPIGILPLQINDNSQHSTVPMPYYGIENSSLLYVWAGACSRCGLWDWLSITAKTKRGESGTVDELVIYQCFRDQNICWYT